MIRTDANESMTTTEQLGNMLVIRTDANKSMTTRAAWEYKSVHKVACSVQKGLPEHFAECPASGLATLVQSHLHRTEGRVCQLSLIFQKEGYIVERVAHGKSNG